MQVPVNQFDITEEDKKAVLDCLNAGWISSEGPYVSEFENLLAEKFDRKYCVAVSSGSAALEIAVRSLKLNENFKAILADHTIISCANSILVNKGKIISIDSDMKNWNQDEELTIKAIKKYKPELILISHTYGLPFQISKIEKLCFEMGIKIIEDAAEMIGQTQLGRKCGSFGDISTLSFYPNKHITTGEGGAILTNDFNLAENFKKYRNLCFLKDRRFFHNEIGWNYRMTSMQASLGISQLKRLNSNIQKKRIIGNYYIEKLFDLKEFIELPLSSHKGDKNIFWVFGIIIKEKLRKYYDGQSFIKKLGEYKIGSRPFFYPLSKQPCLEDYFAWENQDTCLKSIELSKYGLYIPSGIAITKKEQDYVVKSIRDIILECIN